MTVPKAVPQGGDGSWYQARARTQSDSSGSLVCLCRSLSNITAPSELRILPCGMFVHPYMCVCVFTCLYCVNRAYSWL